MSEPNAPRCSFSTGAATALVTPAGIALIDADADSIVVRCTEEMLKSGLSLEKWASEILELGLSALPSFAVAIKRRTAVHLLARGTITVDVKSSATPSRRVDASGATLWREELLDEPSIVTFSMPSVSPSASYWVTGGKFPAGSVTVSFGAPSGSDESLAVDEPVIIWAEPRGEPEGEPVGAVGTADVVSVEVEVEEKEVGVEPEVDEFEVPATSAPAPALTPPTDLGIIDSVPSAESAMVTTSGPTAPQAVAINDGHTVVRISESAGASSDDPDHDGHTVARSRRPPMAFTESSTTQLGPGVVTAVHCPDGHANPPTQINCRKCAVAISDRTIFGIERPTLGVLRFSDNRTVNVDRPIVIGRMPPDLPIGDIDPTVVAIDNSELSRFHACVTTEDWIVYIADQGSMNGTTVTTPGRTATTCRPQERLQVAVGAVVDLGGVITFRYDVS